MATRVFGWSWTTKASTPRNGQRSTRLPRKSAAHAGFVLDFMAALAPAVAAADIGFEAAFIDINDVLCPAFGNDAAQFVKIRHPLFRIAFLVLQRLFCASPSYATPSPCC
jgi:hypothetical protein